MLESFTTLPTQMAYLLQLGKVAEWSRQAMAQLGRQELLVLTPHLLAGFPMVEELGLLLAAQEKRRHQLLALRGRTILQLERPHFMTLIGTARLGAPLV